MYIDPGAGSILIQAATALVIGLAASMSRVRRFFSSLADKFRK
jgi:hypothetical protein